MKPPDPTVLVAAAKHDRVSQAMARDLAVQLGAVPSMQTGSLRLIGDTSSEEPSLVLELTDVSNLHDPGTGLLLKSTADGAIIWSEEFEQGQRSLANMKLQMALTAARVLGCASEALGDDGDQLPSRTRSIYLTACSEAAGAPIYDSQAAAAGLAKVVAQAPRFTPAWRKLLLAEADLADDLSDGAPGVAPHDLRKHIVEARRLDPHIAEATIAEMALAPPTDLVTKLNLIDRADRESPNYPPVLIRRTWLLQSVGRMNEAVATALKAMQADPTSPAVLNNYISALAYGGQTNLAEEQLKRAEQLWPGTNTLDDIEWRFYFRFGDPRIGLRMARNRLVSPSMLLFLEARAKPSKENVDRLISFYLARLGNEAAPDFFMQAFGQSHREQELFPIMLNWPRQADFDQLHDAWFRPALHEFRRDPRFMALAARSPLLKYWRTTGRWPDFCFEPGLPYDCKKEAAKYPI